MHNIWVISYQPHRRSMTYQQAFLDREDAQKAFDLITKTDPSCEGAALQSIVVFSSFEEYQDSGGTLALSERGTFVKKALDKLTREEQSALCL